MPVYEYECLNCGRKYERLLSPEEGKLTSCPDCNTTVGRKISVPSRLKLQTKFTKDGEGFTSVHYSRDEFKERVRHNVGKYDSL